MFIEGELRPEFSESEIEKLGFVKDQADKGKIGGQEDKPSENREFVEHHGPSEEEKADPAWKNLPPELQEEILKRIRSREQKYEKALGVEPVQIDYVRDGSVEEVYFKTIEKNYSELGISLRPDAMDEHGDRIKNASSVWATPQKRTEVEWAMRLTRHPLMDFLVLIEISDLDEQKIDLLSQGHDYEKHNLIPNGTTERMFARSVKNRISHLKSMDPNVNSTEIANGEKELERLGVEPLSDQELEALLLQQVIKPGLEPPKEALR